MHREPPVHPRPGVLGEPPPGLSLLGGQFYWYGAGLSLGAPRASAPASTALQRSIRMMATRDDGILTIPSHRSVDATVMRIEALLNQRVSRCSRSSTTVVRRRKPAFTCPQRSSSYSVVRKQARRSCSRRQALRSTYR